VKLTPAAGIRRRVQTRRCGAARPADTVMNPLVPDSSVNTELLVPVR